MAFVGPPPRLTRAMNANSALVRDLVQQGADSIQRELRNIESDVERKVKELIRADFVARTGFRHKKGDTHLNGAHVRAEVTSNGGSFPITISVTLPNVDPHKVGALEFGSPAHNIPLQAAEFLYFPSNRVGRGKSAGVGKGRGSGVRGFLGGNQETGAGFLAKGGTGSRGGSAKNLTRAKQVHHPGNKPHHFLKNALERAVRQALARDR